MASLPEGSDDSTLSGPFSHRIQSATLQRHSAGNIDYDNLESYDNVPETQHGQDQNNFRTRSKTVSDAMGESRPMASPGRQQWGWGSGREYDFHKKI